MDSICRKIRSRYKFEYDLNAILSDLIYTRVLEPSSKRSSFQAAKQFLEAPTYELHDVYRALSVLAKELDFIQAEVYKNSFFLGSRNDRILYYDCSNYYFEIEQEDGEKAKVHYFLDLDKIVEEEKYDGLYAVCTDLLDDDVADILKVSEGRWQIEDCFRTMKTDFEARPAYVSREDRIRTHFLTCFLALLHFRLLQQSLKSRYTTTQLLQVLKGICFADVEACGFRTDYEFLTKRKMKEIQKKSKNR